MPFADLDDVRIHYELYGDGPPLTLSYVLGGHLGMFRAQAKALAERYRVILWDPRGHGQSSSPAQAQAYGISRSADDLARLLDHIDVDRAHIAGLSMGGGIAARFVQRHPQRAISLCILDSNTAAARPVAAPMRAARERTAALCDAGDMAAAARFYVENSPAYRLFAADTHDNRAAIVTMIESNDPVGFASTLRAMLEPDGSAAALRDIRVPTLVVAGEHDPAIEAIRFTHSQIEGARLHVIPGAGHLSNIDNPDALVAVMREFLDGVNEAQHPNRLQ